MATVSDTQPDKLSEIKAETLAYTLGHFVMLKRRFTL